MKHSRLVCAVVLLSGVSFGIAQTPEPTSKVIDMPADRAADSYAIYSSLIPLGETAGKGWPHELWLVQDTTISAVPDNHPCNPTSGQPTNMNPHIAVHTPAERLQDYLEILRDFDAHCHDRIKLNADGWHVSAPLRLLNAEDQNRFELTRFKFPPNPQDAATFHGAPALYGFSEVYFNVPHTVALVYATQWCGGLCGEGFWSAFELQGGKWKPLPWGSTRWMS